MAIPFKTMKSAQRKTTDAINSSYDSNPQNVLRSIGASGGAGAASNGLANKTSGSDANPTVPSLRLMVEPEHARGGLGCDADQDDILQSTIESAKQIQQLASRLKQTQNELAARESRLQMSVEAHEVSVLQQQHVVDRHLSQLQQHTSQVRLQQRQVMKLQSAIVNSNEATKIAIEQLVSSELTDATTLQHMKAIQHELTDRFDFISRRWKHLFELLENQRVQLEAEESFRDAA